MTAALIHRGPDGDGFFDDGIAALGHRRLSIIDIGGGQQPIASACGRVHLVCNGEIYNSPELRREFTAAGYEFSTQTDVEVILPLYLKYGARCAEQLRGMFAFAIWDQHTNTLVLSRDHLGQKPLFYALRDSQIYFSSEIKSLLASGAIDRGMDLECLWHYISLRYMPEDRSLIDSIKKLPAATTLTWRQGRFDLERYWQPEFTAKRSINENQAIDELDELLQEIVQMHLLSDVPVGAFLSGGIDSSTVVAMAAKATGTPLDTFTIGVEEQEFNEVPYARLVADRYRTKKHERIVKADFIQLMPKMVSAMDEPVDPFGIGLYLVSELASEQVKVVLSGDGGDESFAGYDRFAGQRFVDYYAILPAWLRKNVVSRAVDLIPESFGYKSIAQKARWVNEMSYYSRGERYAHSLSFLRFTMDAKNELLTEQARSQIGNRDSIGLILKYFDADNASDLVDKMLYTDLMTRMPDHLLAMGDRMSMAHSLECRPVMVDYKLVEYAAALPSRMKLKGTRLKYILKRVAERHLDKELIHRKKQGFAFPLGQWMRSDLRRYMLRLFEQSRFVQAGIFRKEYIDRIVNEHLEGKIDHNYRLWILINLEYWYRMSFEGATVDTLSELTEELMASTGEAA